MKTIAAEAGVSVMTVSLSLRNHSSIPESTRNRIREIARKLDYRPDPILGALHAYRKSSHAPVYQGTLAWIDQQYPGVLTGAFAAYLQGATKRANEQGFQVEQFWLSESGMTPERLVNILWSRNVSGLLLAPQPHSHAQLMIDWSKFAVVTFGYTLEHPQLHMVTNHHFRSMTSTLANLRALGYKRIGLALSRDTNNRVEKLWLAAYLADQYTRPASQQIPPFLLNGRISHEKLGHWLKTYKPDAITGIDPLIPEAAESLGYQIPRDLGVAFCGDSLGNPGYSYMNENSQLIGSTAVDFLVGMIQRNEKGVPKDAIRILVDGYWVEGAKTPRASSR